MTSKCLTTLPEEILLIIFGYLDVFDVQQCRKTCHLFKEIIEDDVMLWKKLAQREHMRPFLNSFFLSDDISNVVACQTFWEKLVRSYQTLCQPTEISKHVMEKHLAEVKKTKASDISDNTMFMNNVDFGVICGIRYGVSLVHRENEKYLLLSTPNSQSRLNFLHIEEVRFDYCFVSHFPVVDPNSEWMTFLVVSFNYGSKSVHLSWLQFNHHQITQEKCLKWETDDKNVTNKPEIVTYNNLVAIKMGYCSKVVFRTVVSIFSLENSQFVLLQHINFSALVHTICFVDRKKTLFALKGQNLQIYNHQRKTTELPSGDSPWKLNKTLDIGVPVSLLFILHSVSFGANFIVIFNKIKNKVYLADADQVMKTKCDQNETQCEQNETKCEQLKCDPKSTSQNIKRSNCFNFFPFNRQMYYFLGSLDIDSIEDLKVTMLNKFARLDSQAVINSFKSCLMEQAKALQSFLSSNISSREQPLLRHCKIVLSQVEKKQLTESSEREEKERVRVNLIYYPAHSNEREIYMLDSVL